MTRSTLRSVARSSATVDGLLRVFLRIGLVTLACGGPWCVAHAGEAPSPPPPVPEVPLPVPEVRAPQAPAAQASAFLVGEFHLAKDGVVDADTLRLVEGGSVRVMGIDAEETFKDPAHVVAAERDFDAYAKAMRGDEPRPVKYGTPMGEAAAVYVRTLLRGVKRLQLERDEAGARDRDSFGRRLSYVFFERGGRRYHLAEELVRGGWAPYFVKYGTLAALRRKSSGSPGRSPGQGARHLGHHRLQALSRLR